MESTYDRLAHLTTELEQLTRTARVACECEERRVRHEATLANFEAKKLNRYSAKITGRDLQIRDLQKKARLFKGLFFGALTGYVLSVIAIVASGALS